MRPDLDKATRLASLLYLKAMLQEFPHSRTGPRVLLEELRDALTELSPTNPISHRESGNKEVLGWVAIVGACFSDEEGGMRGWFVEFLREVLGGMYGSGVVVEAREGEMERLLGLEGVFGEAFGWVVREARR